MGLGDPPDLPDPPDPPVLLHPPDPPDPQDQPVQAIPQGLEPPAHRVVPQVQEDRDFRAFQVFLVARGFRVAPAGRAFPGTQEVREVREVRLAQAVREVRPALGFLEDRSGRLAPGRRRRGNQAALAVERSLPQAHAAAVDTSSPVRDRRACSLK